VKYIPDSLFEYARTSDRHQQHLHLPQRAIKVILPDGTRVLRGFDALRFFGSNYDGRIDAGGEIFASLKVLTGAGYLTSLTNVGIRSITLAYRSYLNIKFKIRDVD